MTRHTNDNDEPKKYLDTSPLKALTLHPWSNNIRELHNIIILAAYNTKGEIISECDHDIRESAFSPETRLLLKYTDKDRDLIMGHIVVDVLGQQPQSYLIYRIMLYLNRVRSTE